MDKKTKEKYLWKNYGLTYEEWEELIRYGCWICGKKDGRICVDHRHRKGWKRFPPEERKKEVRSALCFMCNTMLHGVEKRKRARFYLERMVAYFKVYKMVGDE